MEFEKVASIEEIQDRHTYDLTVTPNNNFILANGVLTHNSVREELYINFVGC